MPAKRKNTSTESKFEKLEEIVDSLENSELDLEDVLKLYSEGVEISIELNSRLNEVSKEVLVLKKKLDGAFVLSNFEEYVPGEDSNEGL